MLLQAFLTVALYFSSSVLGAAVELEKKDENHLMARSFGLTVSGSNYLVDTNAGLTFTVNNANCGT